MNAGCDGVVDDYTWTLLPPLNSTYTAVFLSNPFLEHLDVSNTNLTGAGLAFLLIELAHCDPVLDPPGHKFIKQVCIGPPAPRSADTVWHEALPEALHVLQENCPALELCCLVTVHTPDELEAQQPAASLELISDRWKISGDGATVSNALLHGKHAVVLRTKCAPGDPSCVMGDTNSHLLPDHNPLLHNLTTDTWAVQERTQRAVVPPSSCRRISGTG